MEYKYSDADLVSAAAFLVLVKISVPTFFFPFLIFIYKTNQKISHAPKIVIFSSMGRNYQCCVFSCVMWIYPAHIWERDVKFDVVMT